MPIRDEADDHDAWFHANRFRLARGGISFRGDEPGRLDPSERDRRGFRVLLARLSTWHDTLESFTHRLLYPVIAGVEGVYPDLAWVPSEWDGRILSEAGIPWLVGTQSRRGPRGFDVLAFSNALVQETVNVEILLRRSGVPVGFAERMADEGAPLVVLGGANSLHASLLYGEDPPVDGIFLGEEPEIVQELFARAREASEAGLPKAERLAALESVPGFFRADLARPRARKARASRPRLNDWKSLEIVPPAEGVAGTASLQVSEGCPYFCSFCAESWSRKPYRETPLEEARERALEMKRELGLSRIDLYSFNFNTYEPIRPLVAGLLEDFGAVGLKSQRFDALAGDPSFVRLLRAAGKTSITCGLEGISPRLRAYLQKDLSERELEGALDALLRERLRELKIFVIVTGLEEEDDFAAFRATLADLRERLSRSPARPRVTVSSTPLVRFPWTPLEFEDMPDPRTLRRLSGLVKAETVRAGFEFRGAAGVEEAWTSQVLVRARDGRVREAARRARDRTDFVFRDKVTPEFQQALLEELEALGISAADAVAGHGHDDEVPWAELDPGVSRRFLVREHERCRTFLQTPVCLGEVERLGTCQACGACSPEEREAIVHARERPSQDLEALERRVQALRRSEQVVEIRVRLPLEALGLPWDAIEAWHARAWMRTFPSLLRGYRRHEPHVGGEEECCVAGLAVLRPVFLPEAASEVLGILADPERLELLRGELGGRLEVLGGADGRETEARLEVRWNRRPDPTGWLSGSGLKHVLRRDGARRLYELPKEALRKGILRSLSVEEGVDGFRLIADPGPKFDAVGFLRAVFPDDGGGEVPPVPWRT